MGTSLRTICKVLREYQCVICSALPRIVLVRRDRPLIPLCRDGYDLCTKSFRRRRM